MILISLLENSIASMFVEVFKRMTKVSSFYVRTIKIENCIVTSGEQDLSTKFLRLQKKPLVDLQEQLER